MRLVRPSVRLSVCFSLSITRKKHRKKNKRAAVISAAVLNVESQRSCYDALEIVGVIIIIIIIIIKGQCRWISKTSRK